MAVERAPSRYAVRENFRIPGGNDAAQVVGSELEAIALESGVITAASVVERASTVGTLLHEWDSRVGYFERDDAVAATKHREEQARLLIRSIVIKVESGDESLTSRGFFVVGDRGSVKAYQPIDSIAANTEAAEEIRQRFQTELIRLDQQYRAYLAYIEFAKQFQPVFDAVEVVVERAAEEGNVLAKAVRKRYRMRGGHAVLVPNGEA